MSKDYTAFLNSMSKELRSIAKEIDAKVKWCKKEDYMLFAMLYKSGVYIYLEYSNARSIRGRTFTDLTCCNNVTLRQAYYEGDLLGGDNHYCTWSDLKGVLNSMFEYLI